MLGNHLRDVIFASMLTIHKSKNFLIKIVSEHHIKCNLHRISDALNIHGVLTLNPLKSYVLV